MAELIIFYDGALAAFAIASVISNTILRAMKLFTLKRIYQLLGVLGLVILYIYLSLVAIFLYHGIYHGSPIAYQILISGSTMAYNTSMSTTTVFVVSLWIQIIPIYALCRYLLPGYVTGMVPIACLALLQADYIYIPSYPWLWAILIVFQAWCVAIQSSGPIPQAARAIGTIATICGVAAPWSIHLFLRLLVLVGSYTSACYLWIFLLAIVYPRIMKKHYTVRLQSIAARLPCTDPQGTRMERHCLHDQW